MKNTAEKQTVWTPTQVQFLYKHLNGRYYVRTFAGGKEKWASLRTTLLSVAKNRMKEQIDAAERQSSTGESVECVGRLSFAQSLRGLLRRRGVEFWMRRARLLRRRGDGGGCAIVSCKWHVRVYVLNW